MHVPSSMLNYRVLSLLVDNDNLHKRIAFFLHPKKKKRTSPLKWPHFIYTYVVDEILESAHSSILRFIGMVFIKLTLWAAAEYGNGILN